MAAKSKRQMKKQESKANAIKETTKKATPVVEKTVEVKPVEVKTEVAKEVVETKEVAKKTTKKATTKKEMKTMIVVEHEGKQVADKDMIAAVKKAWTKTGKKIGDIKTMTLYVKPEEAAVYYVINDTETGSVEF